MLTKDTLQFLAELAANNEREWFHANKARYERDVKKPFEAFIGAVIERVQAVDPGVLILPKQAVFRINRDTRFSANKSPYKTHLSAVISPFGSKGKEYPGFYIHVEAEKMMLGGGAYFLEKDSLQKVRTVIAEEVAPFRKIIEAPDFVQRYGEVQGEKNKRLPADFQEVATTFPLIANKQFYYMADLPAKSALGRDAVDTAFEYYQAGKPLSDFLAQALR
jgi:uncharacterized protein (TIGR02453 family)